jgi:hypothetical protein
MSSSPDPARHPAPPPAPDAATVEAEARALARDLDAAQRPGRAVPVDPPGEDEDESDGVGPLGGIVP